MIYSDLSIRLVVFDYHAVRRLEVKSALVAALDYVVVNIDVFMYRSFMRSVFGQDVDVVPSASSKAVASNFHVADRTAFEPILRVVGYEY